MRMEINKIPYLKNLQLAHPVSEDDNFEISVLVGADYYWTFIQDQIIRGNGPTAVKSRLGYLLSGPLLKPSTAVHLVHVNFAAVDLQNLDTFWKVESSGISPHTMENNDDFLKTYMQSSITRQPDGALSLKFPWKEDHPSLPSNFSVCAKRTRSLVQRLAKSPELLQMYGQIIADQEHKGFIEKVDNFNTKQTHYIPHRAIRKDSDTTPVRIVYDCSCKQSSHHPSLNDCVHVGPSSICVPYSYASVYMNMASLLTLRKRFFMFSLMSLIETILAFFG